MKIFEISLTNQTKLAWLAVGFTVALTAAMISSIVFLQGFGAVVTYAVWFGVGAGCLCGFVFLMKKVVIEPSLITIADDRVTVLNNNSGNEHRLLFNDIASYQYSVYSGGKQLRIKRKDSTAFRLSDKSEEFATMVREFEAALALYQDQKIVSQLSSAKGENDGAEIRRSDGQVSFALREKTFFEKKTSTVLMAIMSVALVLLTCSVFLSSRPVKGSLFLAYSGYISYASTWVITRKHRGG